MRKITQQAVRAFNANESFSKDNTKVTADHSSTKMFLFGNCIAIKDQEGTRVSHAGWVTRTTFERLNGLDRVRVCIRKGQAYLNGEQWDGNFIKI